MWIIPPYSIFFCTKSFLLSSFIPACNIWGHVTYTKCLWDSCTWNILELSSFNMLWLVSLTKNCLNICSTTKTQTLSKKYTSKIKYSLDFLMSCYVRKINYQNKLWKVLQQNLWFNWKLIRFLKLQVWRKQLVFWNTCTRNWQWKY